MPNFTRSCVVLKSPPTFSQDYRADELTLVNRYVHLHVGLKAGMKTRLGSCFKDNAAAISKSNLPQPEHASLDIEVGI